MLPLHVTTTGGVVRVGDLDARASRTAPKPHGGVVSVTSDSVRFQQFSLVRRGFSPAEVRRYLDEVAKWFDELKLQVVHLADQLQKLQRNDPGQPRAAAGGGDAYGELGARMAEVLRSVDQHAQQVRQEVEEAAGRRAAEAQTEAERIQKEAQTQADRLQTEAREALERAQADAEWTRLQAQDAVKEAREDAASMLSGLTERRTSLLTELHGVLDRMGNIMGQLKTDLAALEAREPEGVSVPHEGEVREELPAHRVAANGAESEEEVIDLEPEYASIDLGRS
jgi:DivIVA domain-containing protein